jgi:hypothetical protein
LAPPIGGSDSISLNSPDLISLSAALGSHISRSHLSISLLPQSLRLSLSYCVRARKGRKKTKKEEEGRIRREKKKRKVEGGLCVNLRKKGKWDGLHVRLGEKGLTGLGFFPLFYFIFKTPIFSKL